MADPASGDRPPEGLGNMGLGGHLSETTGSIGASEGGVGQRRLGAEVLQAYGRPGGRDPDRGKTRMDRRERKSAPGDPQQRSPHLPLLPAGP